MQTNIETKLQELYGEYQKLDNGNYYIKFKNGNELYIPSTISSNQTLLAYAPGAGGSGNDAVHLRNICQSETPPNCVVSISASGSDNYDILTIGTEAINSLGGEVSNAVYASFSASGMKGLQQGEKYLQNNPNVSLSLISCDGCGTYGSYSDKYPTIKETETPFVIVAGNSRYKSVHSKMVDEGYNAYYLRVQNTKKISHIQLNKDMIDYVLLYALGEEDEMPENDLDYALYKGTFDSTVDFENIRCEGAGTLEGYERNKYKSVLKLGALSFTGLDKFGDTDKIGNGYVKADFEFLSSSLNSIRSTISKSNIATKTPTLPISGANGLLSAITACVDKYSTMTVNLYTKLAQETEATQSYGQSIINLDLQQKGQASELNQEINLGVLGALANSGSNGIIPDTNTTTQSTNTNTNQNTNTNVNQNTSTQNNNYTNNSNNNTSQNTNYAGSQNTTQTNNTNTNNNQSSSNTSSNSNHSNTTNTNNNNTNTSTTVTNPIIDGNNMTWKYADGHNLTLTIENGNVTGMKFTYSYDTVEELNKNINTILVGEIDKQYFDKMTIVDKSVEITIKQEYFKELSLDKIKELFFKGGII